MKKLKKDNKGFTLVELIIVIAIIAILGVTAAPQYIVYLERARFANDLNCMQEIGHAAQLEKIGSGITNITDSDVEVTISSDGTFSYATGVLDQKVASIVAPGTYTFVSKTMKPTSGTKTYTITVNANGTVDYGTMPTEAIE